jgi:hypothetical protein
MNNKSMYKENDYQDSSKWNRNLSNRINSGIDEEMERDPTVFVIGEEVAQEKIIISK